MTSIEKICGDFDELSQREPEKHFHVASTATTTGSVLASGSDVSSLRKKSLPCSELTSRRS